MSAIRVFNPILVGTAPCETLPLKNVMKRLDKGVDIHPSYQRDICWDAAMMGDLIHTVMHAGILPPITLYKFQAGDDKPAGSTFEYECVDGQHRLFVLRSFFKSAPVALPGKKPFMVTLKHTHDDGSIVHLFYKETVDTRAFAEETDKAVAYFTEDERDIFNDYCLDLKTINGIQTKEQRIALFLSLSKGKPVTGCDKQKNYHHVPLIALTATQMWESPMKAILRSKCHVKAERFWLHWICRMYLLSQAPTTATFMTLDSQINEYMNKTPAKLASTDESRAAFTEQMERFFAFMDKVKVKVSPSRLFAIFVQLLTADDAKTDILVSHAHHWHETAEQRKLWIGRTTSELARQEYFDAVTAELSSHATIAQPHIGRKTIPKRLRELVWRRDMGDSKDGACWCCKKAITDATCEMGHVDAVAGTGTNKPENLHPICRACNEEMGTQNMYVWMEAQGYARA